MRSSYLQNNYGPIFRNTVVSFKPHSCVELGVLDGYSAFWTALGLERNHIFHSHRGHLCCYDLWEDYPHNHGNEEKVKDILNSKGLLKYVSLKKADAFKVHEDYEKKSICQLHADLSNTGDIFNFMIDKWHPILRMSGLILFEGGSEERDNIEWMKKYNKSSIKKAIETNVIVNRFYQYGTYYNFPSLTVLIKKGE